MTPSRSREADPACPLCGHLEVPVFASPGGLAYYRCKHCDLVFQDPARLPSASEEQELYDHHENSLDDPGYRKFLAPVVDAVVERLAPPASGLDFGCGPGPALAAMLAERGFDMTLYDVFYQPDPQALQRRYDVVTCTETAEHFHQPRQGFEQLFACLRGGGSLVLMTRVLLPEIDFDTWWYHRDPTHVSFYSPECLRWLATAQDARL